MSDFDLSAKISSFSDEKSEENFDQELEGGQTEANTSKY